MKFQQDMININHKQSALFILQSISETLNTLQNSDKLNSTRKPFQMSATNGKTPLMANEHKKISKKKIAQAVIARSE